MKQEARGRVFKILFAKQDRKQRNIEHEIAQTLNEWLNFIHSIATVSEAF